MGERPDALPAIEAEVWAELGRSVADPEHPWRRPVLATTDGTQGDARTVILREVDAAQRQLLIFSDDRAAKMAQIMSHPAGTLVMWSAARGWQLRCRVQLVALPPGLATSSRWARIRLSSAAQDYLSREAPGTPLDARPSASPASLAREHFSVICAQVEAIDWLELDPRGHRRARLCGVASAWLQP